MTITAAPYLPWLPEPIEYIDCNGMERYGRVGLLAVIQDARIKAALRADRSKSALVIHLLDRETGKVYRQSPEFVALDEEDEDAFTLQGYFYFWHHCGCHRAAAIERAGGPHLMPEGSEEGCDRMGRRLLILSVTHPCEPNCNLYWEEDA